VETSSAQVTTHYDFLRFERFVRSDMARPMAGYFLRSLAWIAGDLVSGTTYRIFRASYRFGLHLLWFHLLLFGWITAAAAIGLAAGLAVTNYLALPALAGIATALLVALAALRLLRPLADRWFVVQIANCWVTLRAFARGQATWLDQVIDVGARRLIDRARANDVDELVVVGHSTGSVIALAIYARALELDPDLGRYGPRLLLLTLGSVMPAVALPRSAGRMREIVRRIAIEPTVTWIDCQARKDIMNFANFDPVGGIGVQVGALRCNPLIWLIRFQDMVSPEDYPAFRRNFFRMHFQYIMGNDRPAPYDYILLIGGPMAIADRARRHDELFKAFVRDGKLGSDGSCADGVAGAPSHP
jgi:hypothetical protein